MYNVEHKHTGKPEHSGTEQETDNDELRQHHNAKQANTPLPMHNNNRAVITKQTIEQCMHEMQATVKALNPLK